MSKKCCPQAPFCKGRCQRDCSDNPFPREKFCIEKSRIEGTRSYSFDGRVGNPAPLPPGSPGTFSINETGVFTIANGMINARGVTVFNGTTVLHPVYQCTIAESGGLALATCTRTDENGSVPNLKFELSFGECGEDVGILPLPNPAAPPFDYVQIAGWGGK